MSAPGNTLTVHVVAARAFSVKGGKPVDVYCSLSVSGKGPWKSKVSTNAFKAEPGAATEEELRWDEHCEFQLNDTDTKLVVHLNHKTLFGTTETMGELLFQLDRMPAFQPPAWFRLSKTGTSFDQQQQLPANARDRGQLLLGFQFSNTLGSGANSVSTLSLNKLEKEKKLDRFRRKMQELSRKATGNAPVDSSNADSQSLASISIAAGRHQQLGHGHQGMSRRSSISSVTSGQLAFSSPSPNPPTSIPGDADDSVSMASGGGENFLKGPLEQQQRGGGGSTFWTPDDKSARNESTPVHNLAERFAREGSEGRLAAAAEQQQQTPSSQRLRVKMRQKAEQLLHLRALGTPASKKQHSNMDSAMAAGAELGTSSTAGRRDSVASSSGFVSFGSGQLSALNEHTSPEHLLNVIRHLRRELLKKEERIRDLEEYTDHLITKVMASNPELLAASPKIGGARKLNKRGTANFI